MLQRSDPAAEAAALNALYGACSTVDMLRAVLCDAVLGRVAVVSSFGAEAAVLLHHVAQVNRDTPVLFIDTALLFAETLAYQQRLALALGLRNVTVLRQAEATVASRDPRGDLHRRDPDACCTLRKTAPLQRALAPFEAWVTGRKRFQSGTRGQLALFEADGARVKVNPLAAWSRDDLRAYMQRHVLPPHPLVAKDYPSIGCAPCTSPVRPDEDPRAGRWRGQAKTECGIHFHAGRAIRPEATLRS